MASVFAHGLVAVTAGRISLLTSRPGRFWTLGIICSIIPDADVAGFGFGVSYRDFWGHRGITHSFFFALILALMVATVFFRHSRPFSREWAGLAAYFFVCTASHGALDAMTNGGLGVAFFSPFENGRYFLPWRPIQVAPIGVAGFFSEWGVRVIVSEAVWVGIACAILLTLAARLKRTTPDKP